MNSKKIQHVKLWMVMVAAAVFWTIGAGFFGDLDAKSDETYEGLKIFADVIQLIEKEYVDDVESKELIQNAIQGMVQSLDPPKCHPGHGSKLRPSLLIIAAGSV
jgi:carboxyl-terminal processing protease